MCLLAADAFSYTVGSNITEDSFTCKAFFADSTFTECSADRILDISQVDLLQAGSFITEESGKEVHKPQYHRKKLRAAYDKAIRQMNEDTAPTYIKMSWI